jgi:two-component system CheB/CheR fusion protein
MRMINVDVTPLRASPSGQRCFLVLFEDAGLPVPPGLTKLDPEQPEEERHRVSELRITQLQLELDATRDYLRGVIEDHEAATEELKSAHEEILSSNEELQSINEELQTAKEEMQSANEELNTVNDELRHRNHLLAKLNDDLVNLFTGVNLPIVMVGRDLRIRRMTPLAEKVFNVMPIDVGRRLSDIRPNLEIDDLEGLISQVILSLSVSEREVRDRSGRWYALRVQPYVTLENKIDGASIIAIDIDPLKQAFHEVHSALQTAEAIVDAVRHPVVVVGSDLRIRRANPAFQDLACVPPEDLHDQPLLRVGQGEWNRPELRQALERMRIDGAELALELTLDLPRGPRTLLLHSREVSWNGPNQAHVMVIDDVTEQRTELEQTRMLAQAQAAQTAAEAESRAKDELLATLAHELRNPLAPLGNAMRLLREHSHGEGLLPWATAVAERQLRQLTRILDDLFDVSSLAQNKILVKREPLDLVPLVRRVIEDARSGLQPGEREIELQDPDEPLWVDADPVRLEQVLSNLLSNAVKYTQPGGRIWVRLEADEGRAVLRVCDDGVGIEPSVLPRVFDLFAQAQQPIDRPQGGLGLGLTLVKRLVELHEGTVEAHSAGLGEGAEFVVALPREDTPPLEEPMTDEPPEAQRQQRVLVVDDNRDAADSLSSLLQLFGHEAQTCYEGQTALELVEKHKPDVVFLDIGLPGMDGYEVARELRRRHPEDGPLLVALTGYGGPQDRAATQEAGFHRHLVKPIEPEELERLLVNPSSLRGEP